MRTRGLLFAAALACACARKSPSTTTDAAVDPRDAEAPRAVAPSPSAAEDAGALASAPGGESERTLVAKLDAEPLLAAHLPLVQKHFGEARGPFLVQRLELAAKRRMVLVSSRDESDPMALVADGERLAWSKEHPTAGMIPPALNLAIAARPGGGALLFAYDAPTRAVAARVWADDGSPFADFQVLTLDACDELSAAYWPGRGWLVACAWLGGARAQLLREDGTLAWRRDGADVGAAWRAPAPITIAFDTPDTAMLVQHADVSPALDGDHVVVTRYDARGRPQWAAPVDLGKVPQVGRARDRIVARTAGGSIRVELPRGLVSVDGAGRVRP